MTKEKFKIDGLGVAVTTASMVFGGAFLISALIGLLAHHQGQTTFSLMGLVYSFLIFMITRTDLRVDKIQWEIEVWRLNELKRNESNFKKPKPKTSKR